MTAQKITQNIKGTEIEQTVLFSSLASNKF